MSLYYIDPIRFYNVHEAMRENGSHLSKSDMSTQLVAFANRILRGVWRTDWPVEMRWTIFFFIFVCIFRNQSVKINTPTHKEHTAHRQNAYTQMLLFILTLNNL